MVDSNLTDSGLLDLTHDLILQLNLEGVVITANRPYSDATGFRLDEIVGQSIMECISFDSREACASCLEANASDVPVNGANLTLLKKDEGELRVEARFIPRRVGDEVNVVVFLRSLTEQQAVRQALRESEKRLRTVLEAHPDVLLVIDDDGYCRQVFTSNEDLLVAKSKELIGRTLHESLPDDDADRFMGYIREVLKTRRPLRVEYPLVVKGGVRKWFSAHLVPFGVVQVPRVLWVSRDITQLVEARKTLEEDQHLLRGLLELELKAREVVAYEIHDGFVQHAVGTQLWLQNAQLHVKDASPEIQNSLQIALDAITQGVTEARAMIRDLRPVVVDYLGLANGLNQLVGVMQKKSTIPIQYESCSAIPRMLPLLEAQVLRIVQESLNNVIRHSQASEANVWMRSDDDHIEVEVCDNGIGFDTAKIAPGRYGLEGIKQRARVFGGTASIESRPNKGTCIKVTMPVIEPEDESPTRLSRDAI